MTTADKITSIRVVAAPLFYAVYAAVRYVPACQEGAMLLAALAALWVLLLVAELSDFFDGQTARRLNEVSDFGKLFDPFADTFLRLTVFFTFVEDGILPGFLFLIVLFREYSQIFLRLLMMKKGTALAARPGGKIKAVSFSVTGILALSCKTAALLGKSGAASTLKTVSTAVFAVAALLAIISFADYLIVYRKKGAGK